MLDPALLEHPFSGALLICFEDDRPLRGLIGDLDWRFNGHFTALMKQQVLTGEEGETLYAPLRWNDQTLHFVILGGGLPDSPAKRSAAASRLFEKAIHKMEELGLSSLIASCKDWNIPQEHPAAKERGLWLVN